MTETSRVSQLFDKANLSFFKEHRILPLEPGPPVRIGVVGLPDAEVLSFLRVFYQSPVECVPLDPSVVDEGLERAARALISGDTGVDLGMDPEELSKMAQEVAEERSDIDVTVQAPVIRMVNSLLADALGRRASDIHFDPGEDDVTARFRVDGILHPVRTYSRSLHPAVVSRIKVMARLDIAEKLLPQDGRINLRNVGRQIDVRVSVVPAAHGERVVLRLLDRGTLLSLAELGLTEPQRVKLDEMLRRTNGILLLTGPTGSGKSTTMYSFLQMLNHPGTNIITLEDPVEYKLDGISQIEVKPRIGFTFASGLRSILRQDPDTISVGEIRDGETADLAVHAALTGHRVLSTLHTNDSVGAVARLMDLGVQPFLIGSSLVGVVAQRLVRKLCVCAATGLPTEAFFAVFPEARGKVKEVREAKGCEACLNSGYRGRSGVFEILAISPTLQNEIARGFDESRFRQILSQEGFKPLRVHALEKIASGETSVEEILKIL
ncbi:type II/IV secretion system protein [bacterium]|nr:type II/IV secretion system protein [bacterium]